MDKNQLLSMMQTSESIMEDLQNQIENQYDSLMEKKAEVIKAWTEFTQEFFPQEIYDIWKSLGGYKIVKDEICFELSYSNEVEIESKYDHSYVSQKINIAGYIDRFLNDPSSPKEYAYYSDCLARKMQLLNGAKEVMTQFYQELADRKQAKIDEEKKNLERCLNVTKADNSNKKKYRIVIEIEE